MKDDELIVIQSLLRTFHKISPNLEKFSLWMLSASSAIAALIISNIKDITSILNTEDIRLLLLMLGFSSVFGLCSLIQGLRASNYFRLSEAIITLTKSTDLDINSDFVSKELKNSFPCWFRILITKSENKTIEDPLFPDRKGVKYITYQAAHAFLQCLSLIMFVFLTAVVIS